MADHSFNNEQDAIAAWNMRTPPPVEAELVEALETFSKEYDGFQDGRGKPCPVLMKARKALRSYRARARPKTEEE